MNDLMFRDALPSDMNFILHSWSQSYRLARREKGVSSDVYYTEYRKKIMRICSNSQVLVLSLISKPETIVAYMVFRQKGDIKILSYIYVRKNNREKGLMRKMLLHLGVIDCHTHETPLFENQIDKKNSTKEKLVHVSAIKLDSVYMPYLDDQL